MDSSHSSVVGKENVLEEALRTYEESERSLKSICLTVEQENNDLENQLKILENKQKNLIKQFNLLKQQIEFIQQEHQQLNQKQFIIDQQKNLFHQRYEQIQLALKKILSSSILKNENICEERFSLLGFKLIPINNHQHLTKDIGTNYDPPSSSSTSSSSSSFINNKRKLNESNKDQIDKHHKKNSFLQRSSK